MVLPRELVVVPEVIHPRLRFGFQRLGFTD